MTLTPTELKVCKLVCSGKTHREAASSLTVSYRTIDFHVLNARNKLGVKNTVELTLMLLRTGVFELGELFG